MDRSRKEKANIHLETTANWWVMFDEEIGLRVAEIGENVTMHDTFQKMIQIENYKFFNCLSLLHSKIDFQ